jgi:hypothetical protein
MIDQYYSLHKCPACGKVFKVYCAVDEWGFAYGKRLTCSYHCMRQMEREDKRRIRTDHPAARLYKRMMLGEKTAKLVTSMIAKQEHLRSKEEVRAFVDDWVSYHPAEAQQIRDDAAIQLTHFRQSDIAGMAGVDCSSVRCRADKLGITGKRVSGCVYYTQDEANRIIELLGVTA